MTGDVDDVIDAGHDPDISVAIDVTRIAGQIVAGVAAEIAVAVAGVVLPQRAERPRRQRQVDHDVADLPRGDWRTGIIEHPYVLGGPRHARRPARALTGNGSSRREWAAPGQPVSVCHQ